MAAAAPENATPADEVELKKWRARQRGRVDLEIEPVFY